MLLGRRFAVHRSTIRAAVQFSRPIMSSPPVPSGPVQQSIEEKLRAALEPTHLSVMNESGGHNVPKGSETHFKVVVVSKAFAGILPLERHRKVNGLLEEELKEKGVHALSIVAKTPEQWEKQSTVPESPKCMGGSKR